jgi:hypothetical protein
LSYQWMPLMGQFQIESDQLVFRGGEQPEFRTPESGDSTAGEKPPPQNMVAFAGITLCDQTMVNGTISAVVKFDQVTPKTTCELIFGYDHTSKAHFGAGLGGSGALFSIRAWSNAPSSPHQGSGASRSSWMDLERAGDKRNLRAGIPYRVTVRVHGLEIALDIDGVQVARTILPAPMNEARQVGAFCLSEHDVVVSDFRTDALRPKAFIVMQFSSPYNEVYSHVIKTVCQDLSVDAIRADEIYGPGIIIKDVIDRISESQVIIADISSENPNVYFEVGYALAMRKPIILLAQRRASGTPLPFDLSAFRVLFYDDSISGKPKLEKGLRDHLENILGQN